MPGRSLAWIMRAARAVLTEPRPRPSHTVDGERGVGGCELGFEDGEKRHEISRERVRR
jgi:hypothetical protein